MALTPSEMIPLGTTAPDFLLQDAVSQKKFSFKDVQGEKATVVMFICNHCPFVIHIREALVKTAQVYQEKGIGFVAISANDVIHYPEDSPEKMAILAQSLGFTFPYLYDETQAVAKAYRAACTPDFYVFDRQQACVYRGRYDESTPGNGLPATGQDLHRALDAILADKSVSAIQYPSMGCNIKWKE